MRGLTLAARFVVAVAIILSSPIVSHATVCVVADAGGTALLPPNCSSGYVSPADLHMIIDGLPPGTTIEVDAAHQEFFNVNYSPDGVGGETETFNSFLNLTMSGTGSLLGYNRAISIPNVQDQTHTDPRALGAGEQSFATEMLALQGQIIGDPDFDLLRVTAGTNFGMPSPGHTTLTQLPGGQWNVDSFFDITYRIDFIGAPGGPLAGMSGSTTGTIRMQAGEPPATVFDHFECFKVKDPVKLKGIVTLPSRFGPPYDVAAPGCKIGKARKYCTPVQKVVVSSTPAATPMPGPDVTYDYVCYQLKCPKVDLTENILDQFGARTLGKLKHSELCVPAIKTP